MLFSQFEKIPKQPFLTDTTRLLQRVGMWKTKFYGDENHLIFYDRGRLFGKNFQVREDPSGSVRKGCFQSKSQATNLFIRVICGWNIWNVSRIVKLSRSLSTITLKSTELNWRRYSIICMYRKQKPDQKTLWFDAETSNF